MPNQPKTPLHAFRVPDDVYKAALKKASDEGQTLSEVVRDFLTRYSGLDQV